MSDPQRRESEPDVNEDVGEAFIKAEEEERQAAKRSHDEVSGDVDADGNDNQNADASDTKDVDNEDNDDDDEEDEEEEEEAPRRKRRRAANQFIDIEAEVDDEEEDELDEDDEEAELIREQFISDDRAAEDGARDDRLHREYDLRRQEAEDQDAEELAQTLKEKYRRLHTVYRGDLATSGTVSQKLLMPSINDPAIYGVRCKPGAEKDLVRKLYDKKRTLERRGTPLDILTVFQRDAFRGYIYIEAKRPDAIDKALLGMVNVYVRDKLLVPVKEYPEMLKQVKLTDVEIVPGIYVRITRGNYKGDLAIVDNLSENGLEVRCKLVPRLDYGRNDEYDSEGRKINKRQVVRPLPRLFSEQDARQYDPANLQPGRTRGGFVYKGEEYNGGFLFKDFKLQFIQTKDVRPSLEELDRFQQGKDEEGGLDLAAIAALVKQGVEKGALPFQPGDKVEVRKGELTKTVGQVIEAGISEVVINVTYLGDPQFVNQRITVPAGDLRKIFKEGDHVRVVTGKHAEETGLVIKVDGENVVIVLDLTKQDIKVFANYLVKATDLLATVHDFGLGFDIKDLVQLNAATAGVIVKAERGLYDVLTPDNRIVTVQALGIAAKLKQNRREQVATDRHGLKIEVGDTVKDALGDNHNRQREGIIIHVYKLTVFVQLKEVQQHLGIFATNCINVATVFTKDLMVLKNLGPDLLRMNPNKLAAPGAMAPPSFRGGRDKLIQKDVSVTLGVYKGLMGKVVDSTDTVATIELHTKLKRIKVDKNKLNVLIRGQAIPYVRFIGGPAQSAEPQQQGGSRAYALGGRLAWNGGATPAAGGGTAWGGNPGGGRTPAFSLGNVSQWGGGEKLAWGSGNQSTWGASGGNQLAWGASGGNLTWGSGNQGGSLTWGASNQGGTLTWGSANQGGTLTWGANNDKGGGLTWGSGNKSGNLSWGNKGGNLSWGNKGGNLTWGQGGGGLTWGKKDRGNNSTWGS